MQNLDETAVLSRGPRPLTETPIQSGGVGVSTPATPENLKMKKCLVCNGTGEVPEGA
jgi:hypothetical protein